ncbi:MAG: T9SS type A sorting domain-containing protein [Crocinitomicaceae bacterium]|nr:T9SS type A sorting domain-containing protein [Crocinitomicaceae bacterium]
MHNLIKIAIILIVPFSMFGQINYIKHYSNSGYDAGHGVVQLPDSSYVICGNSSSFNVGPSQAFMMRVDSNGNYMSSYQYGGFESESARRVMYKENFGFFLAGYTNSMGNGAFDFYLVKTDENGTLEWEKSYGTDGWEKVNDAVMTRDTGVIMVGETNSNIETGQDIYIVRTDINGDTLWTKTFGDVGADWATCIERYHDSLYVIGANKWIQDSLKTKAMLIYLKDDGTIIDLDTLVGGDGHWNLNDMVYVNDTLMGVGSHQKHTDSLIRMAHFRFKVSPSDVSNLGYYSLLSAGNVYGEQITVYGDSTSRYASMSNADHVNAYEPGPDVLVVKYGSTFGWQGQVAQIARPETDACGEMIPTSDGGAVAVGYRDGIGEGGGAVFLLKVGPNDVYPATFNATLYGDLVTVESIEMIENLEVFPNPASTSFTVKSPPQDSYEILIVNGMGQIVKRISVVGTNSIDVSDMSPGIYTLIFNDGGMPVGSYRLVIQ